MVGFSTYSECRRDVGQESLLFEFSHDPVRDEDVVRARGVRRNDRGNSRASRRACRIDDVDVSPCVWRKFDPSWVGSIECHPAKRNRGVSSTERCPNSVHRNHLLLTPEDQRD